MSTLPAGLRVLHEADAVRDRIDEIAATIARDAPAGGLCLVVIEEGARRFAESLREGLDRRHRSVELHPVRVHRTRGQQMIPPELGPVVLDGLADRWVLVVDDIADQGRTLQAVIEAVRTIRPAVLRTAVLANKPARREVPVRLDYVGFEVPDLWMVGFGMDLDGRLRELDVLAYLQDPPRSE